MIDLKCHFLRVGTSDLSFRFFPRLIRQADCARDFLLQWPRLHVYSLVFSSRSLRRNMWKKGARTALRREFNEKGRRKK